MTQTRTNRWPRPFVGMRGIGWADVPRETTAGITLAALVIPLNIGFARVAGLPPVVGLYAAVIPLLVCANRFMEEIETLVTQGPTPVRWVVLDAEAMVDIDTTGAEVLHQVLKLLASRGVTFALARAKPQLPSLLQRYKLLELIGADRLYPTNRHAVAALCPERGHGLSQTDT